MKRPRKRASTAVDRAAVERELALARYYQAVEDHLPATALADDTAEARRLCDEATATLRALRELLALDHVGGWVRMSIRPVEAITAASSALAAIKRSLPPPAPPRGRGRPPLAPRGWRKDREAALRRLGLGDEARRLTRAEALRSP